VKAPNQYTPGDTLTVRPLGECSVIESKAAGNYHTNIGWQMTVRSQYGIAVLSYTLASLTTEERKHEG
jgi:hypothetical protein